MRAIILLLVVTLLSGCQSAQTVHSDFDPSHVFAEDRYWAWAEPAVSFHPADDPRIASDLTRSRIAQAVAAQLDTRGLQAVTRSTEADLLVRVHVFDELKQDHVTVSHGAMFGGFWGGGWVGGPLYTETRALDYRELTLQIDLLRAAGTELVWRGSDSTVMRQRPASPEQREQQIRQLVQAILADFPPD